MQGRTDRESVVSLEYLKAPEPDNGLYYMFCDYYATGEGHNICVLVTSLNPRPQDWERAPSWVLGQGYDEGVLRSSVEHVLARQFSEEFDSWFARGMDILERDAFLEKAKPYLPDVVINTIARGGFGGFNYKAQYYVNYS
jgi:hypothetical protein